MRSLLSSILGASLFLTLLLIPFEAHASNHLSGIVNTVGGVLDPFIGGSAVGAGRLVEISLFLTARFTLIVDIVAIFFLVQSGLRLVYRAAEEQVERSKRVIGGSIAAIMLIHLGPTFVDAIFGYTGAIGATRFENIAFVRTGVGILAVETAGVIRWVETIVAAVAVVTILVSGFLAIIDFGSEQGVNQLKRTAFAVIGGILLLVVRQAVIFTFGLQNIFTGGTPSLPGSPDATIILARVIGIFRGLLLFTALIAVGIIVYAGIVMIINSGNEEEVRKMRSLVFRSLIGLLVILVSFAVVTFIFGIF